MSQRAGAPVVAAAGSAPPRELRETTAQATAAARLAASAAAAAAAAKRATRAGGSVSGGADRSGNGGRGKGGSAARGAGSGRRAAAVATETDAAARSALVVELPAGAAGALAEVPARRQSVSGDSVVAPAVPGGELPEADELEVSQVVERLAADCALEAGDSPASSDDAIAAMQGVICDLHTQLLKQTQRADGLENLVMKLASRVQSLEKERGVSRNALAKELLPAAAVGTRRHLKIAMDGVSERLDAAAREAKDRDAAQTEAREAAFKALRGQLDETLEESSSRLNDRMDGVSARQAALHALVDSRLAGESVVAERAAAGAARAPALAPAPGTKPKRKKRGKKASGAGAAAAGTAANAPPPPPQQQQLQQQQETQQETQEPPPPPPQGETSRVLPRPRVLGDAGAPGSQPPATAPATEPTQVRMPEEQRAEEAAPPRQQAQTTTYAAAAAVASRAGPSPALVPVDRSRAVELAERWQALCDVMEVADRDWNAALAERAAARELPADAPGKLSAEAAAQARLNSARSRFFRSRNERGEMWKQLQGLLNPGEQRRLVDHRERVARGQADPAAGPIWLSQYAQRSVRLQAVPGPQHAPTLPPAAPPSMAGALDADSQLAVRLIAGFANFLTRVGGQQFGAAAPLAVRA